MTGSPLDDAEVRGAQPRTRRVLLAVAVVLVVVLVVVGLVVWSGGDDGGSDSGPGATGSTAPSGPTQTTAPEPEDAEDAPTPEPEPAPEDAPEGSAELPPALAAVELGDTSTSPDGTSAVVSDVQAIEGSGTGIGNVGGPALRVSLRIENGSAEPLPLAAVVVELFHSGGSVPASPLEDPSRNAFSGDLAPGESADGAYVFSVPLDGRDLVRVSVAYRPGAPFLVFTGPAA